MPPPSNKPSNKLHDVVPKNHLIFNPWNSASTGHQRAEGPYAGTSEWRTIRTEKLSHQFGKPTTNGSGDGTLGVRNKRGEWRWMTADEAERRRLGCRDIRTLMGGVKKRKVEEDRDRDDGKKRLQLSTSTSTSSSRSGSGSVPSSAQTQTQTSSVSQHGRTQSPSSQSKGYMTSTLAFCNKTNPEPASKPTGIFTGTTIFINGSTFPLISDHKLKHLLASNGANIALILDHRTVTHVVMGKPNGNGGGLAAGKLQRELQRSGSRSVRFVGVEWVLESIKASKRLPESGFSNFMAPRGQQSVLSMFTSKKASLSSSS